MNWQTEFQIDEDKRRGGGITAVWLVVLLLTIAFCSHYNRDDVQALSESARERVIAMKKGA
jgi:hypothetical protein